MLLDARGRVWVGRRRGRTDVWQMPQGGIEAGETPRDAVLRELWEEVGTRRAEILGEIPEWLTYEVPPALARETWGGRFRGQAQRWFALGFSGDDADIDLAVHREPEFDAWRWVPLDALSDLIVDFKRALYQRVIAEFRPLVERRSRGG